MKKQILRFLTAAFSAILLQSAAVSGQTFQLIHNAADPSLDSVDIYIYGQLVQSDFHFRQALTFTLPPGNYPVGIAPGNSSSAADTVRLFNLNLLAGHHYIAMATGVNNTMPGMFSPNPEGRDISLDLILHDNVRTTAADTNNIDLIIMHGATDAPAVDVIPTGVCSGPLVDSAMFGDFTGYLSLPEGGYSINITPANSNSTVIASYYADLNGLGGSSQAIRIRRRTTSRARTSHTTQYSCHRQ